MNFELVRELTKLIEKFWIYKIQMNMSQLISDCIIYDLSQEKLAQVFYCSHSDFLSSFILTPKEFHHHIQHLLLRGKFQNFALTIFRWKLEFDHKSAHRWNLCACWLLVTNGTNFLTFRFFFSVFIQKLAIAKWTKTFNRISIFYLQSKWI